MNEVDSDIDCEALRALVQSDPEHAATIIRMLEASGEMPCKGLESNSQTSE